MCIFSQPVESVNDTQIFARLTKRGTQYLVYRMNYESPGENAMILPLPIRQPAREDSLQFMDLKDYEHFFTDLARGFPYCSSGFGIGCSAPYKGATTGSTLKLFEVGSYIASFVPTLGDFTRLSDRFRLPEETWSRLPQYKDFGFAVFQLAAGALKPHPMAFEFETASKSIYFPTLHIHDGQIHKTEQFDHVLYLQHAGFDSRVYAYQNWNVPDKGTGLVRSQDAAKHFCEMSKSQGIVDGNLLVHKKQMRGEYSNQDTEFAVSGDPARPSLNLRPLWSYTPWLLVIGTIAWFFARRAKVGKDAQPMAARD